MAVMSKLGDLTPEKPIMNDSGVEFISPQTAAIHTSSSSSLFSNSSNGSAYSTPNSLSTNGYSSVYGSQYASQVSSEAAEKSEKNEQKSVAEKSDLISDEEGDSDEEEDGSDEEEDGKSENKENVSSENKKDGLPNKPPKPYLEIIADAILSCSVSFNKAKIFI